MSLLSTVAPVFERRSGYRRLHVDLPGFGASPADPSIDSSDAAVDFVLELIGEVIGDERFLLVGQSWGAYLARAVIAERRDRILGVALDIPVVVATHADRDVAPRVILRDEPGVLDGVGLIDAGEFRQVAVIVDGPAWTPSPRRPPRLLKLVGVCRNRRKTCAWRSACGSRAVR